MSLSRASPSQFQSLRTPLDHRSSVMFQSPVLIRDLAAAQREDALRRASLHRRASAARLERRRRRPDRTRAGPPLQARLWRSLLGE
jgi:hypothetical protein